MGEPWISSLGGNGRLPGDDLDWQARYGEPLLTEWVGEENDTWWELANSTWNLNWVMDNRLSAQTVYQLTGGQYELRVDPPEEHDDYDIPPTYGPSYATEWGDYQGEVPRDPHLLQEFDLMPVRIRDPRADRYHEGKGYTILDARDLGWYTGKPYRPNQVSRAKRAPSYERDRTWCEGGGTVITDPTARQYKDWVCFTCMTTVTVKKAPDHVALARHLRDI